MAWEQIKNDPEFQKQPYEIKQKVAENYFRKNIATQDFLSQPTDIQSKVRDNFLKTIGNEPFSSQVSKFMNRGTGAVAPVGTAPPEAMISVMDEYGSTPPVQTAESVPSTPAQGIHDEGVANIQNLVGKPVSPGMPANVSQLGSAQPAKGVVGLAEAIPANLSGLLLFAPATVAGLGRGTWGKVLGEEDAWQHGLKLAQEIFGQGYQPRTEEGKKAAEQLPWVSPALPFMAVDRIVDKAIPNDWSPEAKAATKLATWTAMLVGPTVYKMGKEAALNKAGKIASLTPGIEMSEADMARTFPDYKRTLIEPRSVGEGQAPVQRLLPPPQAEVPAPVTTTTNKVVLEQMLHAFRNKDDVYQFQHYAEAENIESRLIKTYADDPNFKGMERPTAFGHIIIAPSSKEIGKWQVTALDVDKQPISDYGLMDKKSALKEFWQHTLPIEFDQQRKADALTLTPTEVKGKQVFPIPKEMKNDLVQLKSLIAGMEAPGKLLPNGGVSVSTLPKDLQGLGIVKKDYDVVDNLLNGKPVTKNQFDKVSGIVNEYKQMMGFTGEYEPIKGDNLAVGDKFQIRGEDFTVKSVDADTGKAKVTDGTTHIVSPDELFPVDMGSYKPVQRETGFEPPPFELTTQVPIQPKTKPVQEGLALGQQELRAPEHQNLPVNMNELPLGKATNELADREANLKLSLGNQRGATNLNALTLGLAEDIIPTVGNLANAAIEIKTDLKNTFTPSKAGPAAQQVSGSMRENLAIMANKFDKVVASLDTVHKFFDKQKPEANYDFIDKMERGEPQSDPQKSLIADSLRQLLDARRTEIQNLGTGKLEEFYTNYFPHIWEKPGVARDLVQRFLGRRPLEGSKNFLKQRTYDYFSQGLAAGLKPVSNNPVDLVFLKVREMDRYIMAHHVINEMKDNGLFKFYRSYKDVPEGWIKIDDRISTVFYKNEAGEMVQAGHYYAPSEAARIINNYLSPGLQGKALYRAYRGLGNILNRFQLGLSLFHLGFTSVDAATSRMALAINQMAHGKPIKAFKSLATVPVSPVTNAFKGNKLYKAWFSDNIQDPELAKILEGALAGGNRVKMDQFYQTAISERMVKAFKNGNIIGAALRLPFAVVEQASRPMMEYIVPRQKLGVFYDLMKQELEQNPNMTHEQLRITAGKIVDSVDNRMGQLIYDNLFWNKIVKDLSMASVRSLGWNLGTFREIGGGLHDFIQQPINMFKGKKPEMTYRMAYVLALPITVGIIGAITHYLMTGKHPEELKDYYFPKTGRLDENGRPARIALPSYMRDVYGFSHDPIATVTHKLSPSLNVMAEMLNNEDFYGVKIRNLDDPAMRQVLDLIKFGVGSFEPFGIRGIRKEAERGAGLEKFLPEIGLTPAPAYINQTPAEQVAQKLAALTMSRDARTREEWERSQASKNYTMRLKKAKTPAEQKAILDEVIADFKADKLTSSNVKNIARRTVQTPLERSIGFLSVDALFKVYDVANEEERKILVPQIIKAYKREHRTMTMEETGTYIKRMKEILGK